MTIQFKLCRAETFADPAGEVDATWTHQRTGPGNRINYDGSGNVKSAVDGSDAFIFDNVSAYTPDQYVRGKISALAGGSNQARVTARASLAGDANYLCYYAKTDGTTAQLGKIIQDVDFPLGSLAAPFTVADWIELWVIANRVMMAKNGALIASAADSQLDAGAAGLGLEVVTATSAMFSDWEGGNIVVDNGPLGPMSPSQRMR